jgi:amino-acid N-acetyltransferase
MNLSSEKKLQEIYLITTTAAPFFEKQGFLQVDRARVPEAIRQTAQFTGGCPATATVMFREA